MGDRDTRQHGRHDLAGEEGVKSQKSPYGDFWVQGQILPFGKIWKFDPRTERSTRQLLRSQAKKAFETAGGLLKVVKDTIRKRNPRIDFKF